MAPQWYVQLNWLGTWVTVAGGFATRADAVDAVVRWRIENYHSGNNFRYRQQADTPPAGEDTLQDLGIA